MIPQQTVSQILDAARIEEVVGDFVNLKRHGASYTACCPFHNEKTPSFVVTPSKGIYKCFGCGKAGSSVGFVMEHEHMSYAEALRYLAAKYHIEIVEKEETAEEIAMRQRTESLYLVCEFAQKFYVDSLQSPEGKAYALAYYKSRGVEPEWIEKFGLGWAPRSRRALCDAALAAGYKEEYLVEAGLASRHEDGTITDKFVERVSFPIYSVSGRVIAFSCRTLSTDSKISKYINSPETEIYIKGRILFGLWQAKSAISKMNKCILVEGNLDVVSMHQKGIGNVVASCGTALTSAQVKLISKFTDNITVMYDDDQAGIKAAVKAVSLILSEGMGLKLVLLPDGDDPDSFCRKHSREEIEAYISEHEQDFVSFIADHRGGNSTDPAQRIEAINTIISAISLISDPVKRSVYVGVLSSRFSMSEDVILSGIKTERKRLQEEKRKIEERAKRREEAGLDAVSPDEQAEIQVQSPVPNEMTLESLEQNKIVAKAEEDLLSFLLTNGEDQLVFPTDSEFYSEEYSSTVADFIFSAMEEDNSHFLNPAFAAVYDAYLKLYDEGKSQDVIVKALLDSEDRTVAFVASVLSTEKYRITVKSFADAMTSTDSWLATYVPHAILAYVERRVANQIEELTKELASTDDDALLREMTKLLSVQKSLKTKLGREKKK